MDALGQSKLRHHFFVNRSLNKDIPIPLYYQLKEVLLEYIKNYHEDLEEPIPTEMELSNQFNISRPTVRQAINELAVEGYLTRVKGKGTFILKPRITQKFLLALDSFNDEMRQKGLTPSTKLLSGKVVPSNERVSNALGVKSGTDVVELRRLRFADGEPIVVVVTYIAQEKCSGLLAKDLEGRSLYEILESDYGLTIYSATRNLEAIAAGSYEAHLLEIEKGDPVHFSESIVYLMDGSPIEYSLAKYRGDRNSFTVKYTRRQGVPRG